MKTRIHSSYPTIRLRMLILAIASLVVVSVLTVHTNVLAQGVQKTIPYAISYQGSISSHDGALVNGEHRITATLYGNPLGTEQIWQGAYSTTVTNGIFSILLGDSKYPLPDPATLDQRLWVGISIDGEEELRPLARLGVVPIAINVADEAITKAKLAPEVVAMMMAGQGGQDPQIVVDNTCLGNNDAGVPSNFVGGGSNNTATPGAGCGSGFATIVGGLANNAPAIFTFIGGGVGNLAGTPYSTVGGGNTNTITADYGFIGGGFANIIGGGFIKRNSTIAGGSSNSIHALSGAIGGGGGNLVSADFSGIASGNSNVVITSHSDIGGGWQNRIDGAVEEHRLSVIGGGSTNHITAFGAGILGGAGNEVLANYSVIVGGNLNTINNNADFGFIGGGDGNTIWEWAQYSVIGGGQDNQLQGLHSVIGGGLENEIVLSKSFIGGGYSNKIGGEYSAIGGGYDNQIAKTYSFIGGGNSNLTLGYYTVIGGGDDNTAVKEYSSVIGGQGAITMNYGQMAQASGTFATQGDAQTSVFVLRNQTTDATATSLFLDGAGQQIAMPGNGAMTFHILIVGKTTGNSGPPIVGGFEVSGTAFDNAGSATLVGPLNIIPFGAGGGWTVTVGPGTFTQFLDIQVTGTASTTIDWVARVQTAEVIF